MTLRELRYRFFSWRSFPKLEPSEEPIDVVIPIIEKDLNILPLCLEGIKRCVVHNIKDIYIIAPCKEEILIFCDKHNLRYIDENCVFGYSPRELNVITTSGINRSGWMFQQFIKLSGKIGTCRYYLCIDADHILIKPHVFLTKNGETVFYMSYENHQPYYDEIRRLLPGTDIAGLSFVAHKMLFDKEEIEKLHREISLKNDGKPWQQAILDTIDRNTIAGFSEFETYGNFVTKKILMPWKQKRLPYSKLRDFNTLKRKYEKSRWSLTFPDYMRQNKK